VHNDAGNLDYPATFCGVYCRNRFDLGRDVAGDGDCLLSGAASVKPWIQTRSSDAARPDRCSVKTAISVSVAPWIDRSFDRRRSRSAFSCVGIDQQQRGYVRTSHEEDSTRRRNYMAGDNSASSTQRALCRQPMNCLSWAIVPDVPSMHRLVVSVDDNVGGSPMGE
jgi:hypothetical protein